MRRAAAALMMALASGTCLAQEAASPGTAKAYNWNLNPLGCPRKPAWVRAEMGYFFVSLAVDPPPTPMELLAEARRTGTSTLVLLDWEAPARNGFAELALADALWSSSRGIRFEIARPAATGRDDGPAPLVRFSWKRDISFNEHVRVDLPESAWIDAARRPLMKLRLRADTAGTFLTLQLCGGDGLIIERPLPLAKANEWTTFGPFAVAKSVNGRMLTTIHAIRFVKTTPPNATEGDVNVELAGIEATASGVVLDESWIPRRGLGSDEVFAEAVRAVRRAGGHVLLELDASGVPHGRRLMSESLKAWGARTEDGSPAWSVDAKGDIRFAMRADGGWPEYLAQSISEKLMGFYGADGAYVRGLDVADDEHEKSRSKQADALALLQRLRAAVKSTDVDGALFVDRASALTLRCADVAAGPPSDRLRSFRYACAGIVADIPVRSAGDIDALHSIAGLGLKFVNDRADLSRLCEQTPGTLKSVVIPARTAEKEARESLATYKRRLAKVREECDGFFDFWRGGRWQGRVHTNIDRCEIMHFTVGREHLYTIVNTSSEPTGLIVLDVSKIRADSFRDAVTGETVSVRNGYLNVELGPHALAMLYTTFTTGRVKGPRLITTLIDD